MLYKNRISKILYSLLLVSLLVLLGCTKNANPIDPSSSKAPIFIDTILFNIKIDPDLKNKIIGSWKFSSNVLHFSEDGTYHDSIYSTPHPWGIDSFNVCTEVEENGYFLNQVSNGIYEIENGVIKKQPLEFTIDCNPLKAPASYIYIYDIAELTNDTLKLTNFYVWETTGSNNDEIWGNWKTDYWIWAYHNGLPSGGAPQLITEYISFYRDSSHFNSRFEGFPYEGIEYKGNFIYNPPNLTTTYDDSEYIVSIKDNRMYWYYKDFTYNYVRIKN